MCTANITIFLISLQILYIVVLFTCKTPPELSKLCSIIRMVWQSISMFYESFLLQCPNCLSVKVLIDSHCPQLIWKAGLAAANLCEIGGHITAFAMEKISVMLSLQNRIYRVWLKNCV